MNFVAFIAVSEDHVKASWMAQISHMFHPSKWLFSLVVIMLIALGSL